MAEVTTAYTAKFPNALFEGNTQRETRSGSNRRIAEALDYNIHDEEIQALQAALGTGLSNVGVPPGIEDDIAALQSDVSDIQNDILALQSATGQLDARVTALESGGGGGGTGVSPEYDVIVPDDFATPMAAINDAVTNNTGDIKIFVRDGVYDDTSAGTGVVDFTSETEMNEQLVIVGESIDGVIWDFDGLSVVGNSDRSQFVMKRMTIGASGGGGTPVVSLTDLGPSTEISDLYWVADEDGTSEYSISMTDCKGGAIRRVNFDDGPTFANQRAVELLGCVGTVIEDSLFTTGQSSGGANYGTPMVVLDFSGSLSTDHVTIQRCSFSNPFNGQKQYIFVDGEAEHITIADCDFTASDDHHLIEFGSTGIRTHIHVLRNEFNFTADPGASLLSTSAIAFTGGTARGVRIHDNIARSTSTDFTTSFILLTADHTLIDCQISRNHMRGICESSEIANSGALIRTGSGVVLGSSGGFWKNVVIADNVGDPIGTEAAFMFLDVEDGWAPAAAGGITIKGNKGFTACVIDNASGTAGQIDRVHIIDNEFLGEAEFESVLYRALHLLIGVLDLVISGNRVEELRLETSGNIGALENVVISGNIVNDGHTTVSDVFELTAGDGGVFRNVSVTGNTIWGGSFILSTASAAGMLAEGVSFTGNTYKSGSTSGAKAFQLITNDADDVMRCISFCGNTWVHDVSSGTQRMVQTDGPGDISGIMTGNVMDGAGITPDLLNTASHSGGGTFVEGADNHISTI